MSDSRAQQELISESAIQSDIKNALCQIGLGASCSLKSKGCAWIKGHNCPTAPCRPYRLGDKTLLGLGTKGPSCCQASRLIYKLYWEGDGTSGPLGVSGITRWLNDRGYRTRKGALFGVGPTHKILTARYYMTGLWPHGVDRSNTRLTRPAAEPVDIPVPKIIEEETFEAVQRTLAERNPKVTAPREVNGPSLLIGLAKCGLCGASMTRTGTTRGKRRYSYYSCAGCHAKGKSACTGQHIRTELLDNAVMKAIRDHVLNPVRLEALLQGLIDRHRQNQANVDQRLRDLKATFEDARSKLSRLCKLVEDGDIAIDDELKTRIANAKALKEKAEARLAWASAFSTATVSRLVCGGSSGMTKLGFNNC